MNGVDAFFVDSNVPLYHVDRLNAEKQLRATDWLNHLWMSAAGRLSWQVLHEFYSNAVGKMRVETTDARHIAEELSQWNPVETSVGLIREAWHWIDADQLNYWDALIVAAAQRCGARYLLSEDFQHGRSFGPVEVVNPFRRPPSDFSWQSARPVQ